MINNSNKKILISISLILFSFFLIYSDKKTSAEIDFVQNIKGKILLQVEEHGEAWYISPYTLKKYYLGTPDQAFEIMQDLGIGISNNDIKKIPIALENNEGKDTDNDGLSDYIEDSLGTDKNTADTDNDGYDDKTEILNNYNPTDNSINKIDENLQKKLSGSIIIQTEQNGEAWYINPNNLKRYYLGRPLDAFNIMKKLGLGATNNDIAKIQSHKNEPSILNNLINQTANLLTSNTRKYIDKKFNYSFEYPSNWKKSNNIKKEYITQITNANSDFILENKGVITFYHIESKYNENSTSFRIATKGKSKTITDATTTVHNFEAYENSYKHPRAYEKVTTIQVDNNKFLQITLTTKQKNAEYEKIYNDILDSIKFEIEQ